MSNDVINIQAVSYHSIPLLCGTTWRAAHGGLIGKTEMGEIGG